MATTTTGRPGAGNAGGHRVMTFLTADIERRALIAIARRLPSAIRPNHLTAVGVLGAAGAGVAYAATSWHPGWLLAACLALGVNWFGDSLDGTLARVRKVERPRYGYYLDHVVDAFNTVAVGLGLGLSPYVSAELALGLVILYLALSINVYIETAVYGEFRMAYGRIGPTEFRILLVLGSTMVFGLSRVLSVADLSAITNALAVLSAVGASALLVWRFAVNLRHLARLEPSRRHPAQAVRAS